MYKILLIEDDDNLYKNIKEFLQVSQYEIITAKNGKEGIKRVEKDLPDLIICNISIPKSNELDGYDVLKILQRNNIILHVPFILLTNQKWNRIDFRKAMELGATDYLARPFNYIEVFNIIEVQLKKLQTKLQTNTVQNNNEVKKEDLLKRFLEKSEVYTYVKNEEIYRESTHLRGVYYLSKGKVKTQRASDYGKDLIHTIYSAGEFFGFIPLLLQEEQQYYLSAIAMENSEVYLIPKDDFHNLIFNNISFSQEFIKILTKRLREKDEQLTKLAYNSVRKKVADVLVLLHNKYKDSNGEYESSISISRKDLSDLAGIATETAIRTLGEFKEEKLIKITHGNITICDLDKLINMHN